MFCYSWIQEYRQCSGKLPLSQLFCGACSCHQLTPATPEPRRLSLSSSSLPSEFFSAFLIPQGEVTKRWWCDQGCPRLQKEGSEPRLGLEQRKLGRAVLLDSVTFISECAPSPFWTVFALFQKAPSLGKLCLTLLQMLF